MFQIQDKQLKDLERKLGDVAKQALPFATRQTLNQAAFAAQKIARADLAKEFTLRNRFTVSSVRVEKTKTLNIRQQGAIVGSIAEYLETQEFGGIENNNGKAKPLATNFAAGLARGARPRGKLPRPSRKLARIAFTNSKVRAKGKRQELLVKTQQAVNSSNKFFYHDFGQTKGIFFVQGGKKNQRAGWPVGAKLEMVWDMSRKSVVIKKQPWLKPAFDEATRMIPAFYADALRFQLRRRGLM